MSKKTPISSLVGSRTQLDKALSELIEKEGRDNLFSIKQALQAFAVVHPDTTLRVIDQCDALRAGPILVRPWPDPEREITYIFKDSGVVTRIYRLRAKKFSHPLSGVCDIIRKIVREFRIMAREHTTPHDQWYADHAELLNDVARPLRSFMQRPVRA